MRRFFLLLLVIVTTMMLVGCGSTRELRFGTGGTGGMYYAYGSVLADHVKQSSDGYLLDVKATAGSAANIRLIREGFLDFGIVQSDILATAPDQNAMFNTEGVAFVGVSYNVPCQIVVRADSNIKSIVVLAGKRVAVGEEESGALKNATEILLAHGLTLGMVRPLHYSFIDAAAALERNEVDAVFITAGVPTKAIAELADKVDVRFLAVEPDIINNMMQVYRGYTRCAIPANTYKEQTTDINTIGARAVLITGTDVADRDVEFMTKLIFDGGLDMNDAVMGIDGGFHAGAANFYKAHGITVEEYKGGSAQTVIAGQD